jgi:PHS family inorganic phosphate transporter-like MFS transporter
VAHFSYRLFLTAQQQRPRKKLCDTLRFGCYNTLRIVHYNFWPLLGTAGAWFLLDVVFYANGLFSGQVTDAMNFTSSPRSEATASLLLQAISLPGYICSALFAATIGLRRLQLWGFAATASIFLALSVLQPYLAQAPAAYLALYGLTFFAQNFGPNTTTYIIPSLQFPPDHRGTCHGISAAAGKLGALLAAQVSS